MSPGRITTIVLAAGASARLGRPKQLVVVDGRPLVARAARTAIAAGLGPVIVILGAQAEAVGAALEGLDIVRIHNAAWQGGVGASIAAGVAAAAQDPACEAVIVMTCDQPHVSARHLAALASRWRESGEDAVGSAYGGAVGVPGLFSRRLFRDLGTLTGDTGARQLLAGRPAVACPACEADVDTQTDLSGL